MEIESSRAAIPMDTIDGGRLPDSDNNNHVSTLMSASFRHFKSKNAYLENNLPLSAEVKLSPPVNSYLHKEKFRREETAMDTDDLNGFEELTCDIICNCDGTVFLVPSELSSKLLAPNGVLNELTDTQFSPFPTAAKTLYYYKEGNDINQRIISYKLDSNNTAISCKPSQNNQLYLCLPCRKSFYHVNQIFHHSSTVHKLEQETSIHINQSVIIQAVSSKPASLHTMVLDQMMSTDVLLSKDQRCENSASRTSSITSPPHSAGLFSPTHQKVTPAGCDEHPEGGIECPKCDLILSSTKSLGGHMTMMHSRNSCKTLKCPKCNWHYKYQETLEIHMKEKHPETDQTCVYCVTKQNHPKLSRGESYMCGYKPYRCDVCNYSTTTKGNLSIHMQSDKHINNMQELQQVAIQSSLSSPSVQDVTSTLSSPVMPPVSSTTSVSSPTSPPLQQNSQNNKNKSIKNTWRCDVCNYETNIARNLRIHMTSEKHTHNMLILQQNVKSMQRNMHMTVASIGLNSSQADAAALQQLGTMFPFDPLGIVGQMEALSQGSSESDTNKINEDLLNSQLKCSKDVYGCIICNVYTTDDLSQLEQHLNVDRSITNNAENVTITPENHYLCNLCQYKTGLKANFQLHCKTDKHVQRVQLVNHIREGGSENEWRMRYLSIPNPVHILCNVCCYHSNSIHKMRIHSLSLSHAVGTSLFVHLRRSDEMTTKYHQHCGLCSEQTSNKIAMVHHVRVQHAANMEQLCSENWPDFTVLPGSAENEKVLMETQVEDSRGSNDADNSQENVNVEDFECSHCSFAAPSAVLLQNHMTSHHNVTNLACPLCSNQLSGIESLEKHLCSVHNVNKEGANRLIAILDMSAWKGKDDEEAEDLYRCQTCTEVFTDFDMLCQHQNELGHFEMKSTPRGTGYLCWKKGCNQYFKTVQSLQVHFKEIHSKQSSIPQKNQPDDSTAENSTNQEVTGLNKCFICNHEFRSKAAIKTHIEVTHYDSMTEEQMLLYKKYTAAHSSVPDRSATAAHDNIDADESYEHSDLVIDESKTNQERTHLVQAVEVETNKPLKVNEPAATNRKSSTTSQPSATDAGPAFPLINGLSIASPIIKSEPIKRDNKPYKCNICNTSYTISNELDEHLTSTAHQNVCTALTRQISSNQHNAMDYVKDVSSCRNAEASKQPFDSHEAYHKEQTNNGAVKKATEQEPALVDKDSIDIATLPESKTALPESKAASFESKAASFEGKITTSEKDRSSAIFEKPVDPNTSRRQMHSCQSCGSVFPSEELLVHHKQFQCYSVNQARRTRSSRAVYRKLLENFGIECVMGFLESGQHKAYLMDESASENLSSDENEEELKSGISPMASSPPEMSGGKVTCSDCGQRFSGIWVLKTHKEEEHNKILPEGITNHFGNLYKEDFDKKELMAKTSSENDDQLSTKQEVIESSSQTPTSAPSQTPAKPEPLNKISASQSSFARGPSNPLDILSYSQASMAPWLSIFPFGMMPNGMFNPLLPPLGIPSTHQNNPMTSPPPALPSPSVEANSSMTLNQNNSTSIQQSGIEKRPRTRISDDQLKVLRQYFDINNSPSEESIVEMANKTSLPAKVIKHWFRNTLFKERQKNKDSPYNFNNPPQTTLNLEEYEKTGKVHKDAASKDNVMTMMPTDDCDDKTFANDNVKLTPTRPPAVCDTRPAVCDTSTDRAQSEKFSAMEQFEEDDGELHHTLTRHEDVDLDKYSANTAPSLTGSDNDSTMMSPNSPLTSVCSDGMSQSNVFSKLFSSSPYKFHEYSNSSGSKRANRTRFTDYQIKTLQDYFEQNAYPKDEELDRLSKILQLPNRVIVVWFQNARQKARKVYENSPASDSASAAPSNKNTYPCKKCGVVFSGYYELVKHQKRVCMKNINVPLPFGSQDGSSQSLSATELGTDNVLNSTADKLTDMTKTTSDKDALSEKKSSLLTRLHTERTPTQMNLPSNAMNPLLNPALFPLLPGVPMQNAVRDLYEQSMKKFFEDSQQTIPSPSTSQHITSNSPGQKQSSDEIKLSTHGNPLDLSRVLSEQKVIATKNTDTKANTHTKASTTSSNADEQFSDGESETADGASSPNRMRNYSGQTGGSSKSSQNKRYRTNLTNMQIHVMKNMFKDYKTPTMAECEILGGFIGLQKRVVQVWFQNARAKEKKSKVASDAIDNEPVSSRCSVCDVAYSHQCTLQDHIFSAKHINKIRRSFTGKLTDIDKAAMCKQDESNRISQSVSKRVSSGTRKTETDSAFASSLLPGVSPRTSALNGGHDSKDFHAQMSRNLLASLNPLAAAGMMNAPGTDMLSLVYSGMMSHLPMLPGLLPNSFGTEQLGLPSLCNPLDFGTPLSLLQIPSAAIRSISSKLNDTDHSVATYTQDCMTLNDLENEISNEDLATVKNNSVDVGYACRRCQFVFPRKEACATHQTSTCFLGKNPSKDTFLKIEQQQFGCKACGENLATVQEFKLHCSLETHKFMRLKLANNNNNDNDLSQSPAAKRLKI